VGISTTEVLPWPPSPLNKSSKFLPRRRPVWKRREGYSGYPETSHTKLQHAATFQRSAWESASLCSRPHCVANLGSSRENRRYGSVRRGTARCGELQRIFKFPMAMMASRQLSARGVHRGTVSSRSEAT
jgi:hypothetical protein